MKKAYKGIATYYIDIDEEVWTQEKLKNWSGFYAEVDTLEELAEDILGRYLNGNLDLPEGISIEDSDVFIE